MNETNNINTDTTINAEMTAGEMLRTARTTGRRKREIPTISKQLCIREEFLEALEQGNYSLIPEPVYILGFARNYAMELGLNPDEVVAKIKREMGLVSECVADGDAPDVASCAVRAFSWRAIVARIATFVRRRWIWLAGGLVVLILIAIFASIVFSGGDAAPDGDDAPVVAVSTTTDPAFTKKVRERFGTENRDKSRVILQVTKKDSWVKIEDGRGNTVFSRVLVSGDVYYVPAGANYKATFGNAGGVDIWVDGVLAERAGADYTRKSDISLNPDELKPRAPADASDTAE